MKIQVDGNDVMLWFLILSESLLRGPHTNISRSCQNTFSSLVWCFSSVTEEIQISSI